MHAQIGRLILEKKALKKEVESLTPPPAPPRPKLPTWIFEWNAVRERLPVGASFDYLGRKMVVKTVRDYIQVPGNSWCGPEVYMPRITAEYADNHGLIHEHVFETQPWVILSNV